MATLLNKAFEVRTSTSLTSFTQEKKYPILVNATIKYDMRSKEKIRKKCISFSFARSIWNIILINYLLKEIRLAE
jgi:hypothetical protein